MFVQKCNMKSIKFSKLLSSRAILMPRKQQLNARYIPMIGQSLLMSSSRKPRINEGLESVKEQGLKVLESTLSDIQVKTKRRLLIEDEDNGPTVSQMKEAMTIKRFVEDAVLMYTSQRGNLFCIMDEPIAIIDVEITEDLKHARVFWSLPFGVLLLGDDVIKRSTREKLTRRMQIILNERGGVLQGMTHVKMRHYFRPPKIHFVPAESEMLRAAMQRIF